MTTAWKWFIVTPAPIAAGRERLGLTKKAKGVALKRGVGSVGQGRLMNTTNAFLKSTYQPSVRRCLPKSVAGYAAPVYTEYPQHALALLNGRHSDY